MARNYGTRNGLSGGLSVDGEAEPGIESGSGTPTHSAPLGTVYVDLNATLGTSSHFRNSDGAGTWVAMSDDA
jgi:hypothetical protein